ncbi:hypothetical protein [[Leptolyngbya] sp. PCC 7376]
MEMVFRMLKRFRALQNRGMNGGC